MVCLFLPGENLQMATELAEAIVQQAKILEERRVLGRPMLRIQTAFEHVVYDDGEEIDAFPYDDVGSHVMIWLQLVCFDLSSLTLISLPMLSPTASAGSIQGIHPGRHSGLHDRGEDMFLSKSGFSG